MARGGFPKEKSSVIEKRDRSESKQVEASVIRRSQYLTLAILGESVELSECHVNSDWMKREAVTTF